MVWGYSLVFALFICSGNNTVGLLRIFIVAVVFSIAMESLQLTNIVRGTFDVFDIMVEVLSEGVAVFIIQKYYMRRNENEEKI
jgi:glycopeptide antibiotics resistance protein